MLGIEVLETGTGNLSVEVLSVEERVNFDGGLRGSSTGCAWLARKRSASRAAHLASAGDRSFLGLALEFLLEMIKQVGVEVLTSQDGYHQQWP